MICDNMIDKNGNDIGDNEYYNNCGACWYKDVISNLQHKIDKL